jgi:hypothetical protein
MTGTYLDMFPPEMLVVLEKVYAVSVKNFGFTPTLWQDNDRMFTLGELVVYLDVPKWPAGSPHTTAQYIAELKSISTQYAVALGVLFISIKFTAA